MVNSDKKIARLYQQIRLQQPNADLDNTILLAAKAQLASKQRKPKKFIWAVSSVAIIVLSVNVALKVFINPTASPESFQHDIMQDALPPSMENAPKSPALKENNMRIRQQVKKKAIQQHNQATQQKRIPRMMRSPSPSAASSAEAIMFSDTMIATPALPVFPFNKDALSQLYPALNIKQTQKELIQIYHSGQLILSLKQLNDTSITVTAYPQDKELNLTINWTLKPTCELNQSNKQCALNKKQTGFYKNKRLVKVTWVQ